MSTMDDITSGARTILRDFPIFFEADQGPLNTLSIRLPSPLINGKTLGVYITDTAVTTPVTTLTTAWKLDERNGILKITDDTALNKRVLISGYHYSWFLDSDIAFHANQVWGEMSYYDELSLNTLQPAQVQVVELGAVVHALWSLSMELSLDIDVSTPEGMMIPARQRFTQVMQMLQYYGAEYESKASMMNMGLNGLSQFQLRRVAYLTGRYVPVYQAREIDHRGPPVRLYPPIPEGVPAAPKSDADLVEQFVSGEITTTVRTSTAYDRGVESWDLGYGGWYPIGSSGAP
jgi:hypothetical protein